MVTGGDTQSSSTSQVVDITSAKTKGPELNHQDNSLYNQSRTRVAIDNSSTARKTVSLAIADMDSKDHALSKYSEGLSDASRSQYVQSSDIIQSLDRQFYQLLINNEMLQKQLTQGQQQLQQQQKNHEDLLRVHEDLLQELQQTRSELVEKQQ